MAPGGSVSILRTGLTRRRGLTCG